MGVGGYAGVMMHANAGRWIGLGALVLATSAVAHADDPALTSAVTLSPADEPPKAETPPPAPAPAEDKPRLEEVKDLDWRISIKPRVWYVAPAGKLQMPGSTNRPKLGDLNADNPRLSPYGEADIKFGRWRISMSGFAFSMKPLFNPAGPGQIGRLSYVGGDQLRTKLDFSSGQILGGYRIGRWPMAGADGREAFVPELVGLFGARVHQVDFTLTKIGGASQESNQTYLEAVGGVRLDMDLARNWSINVHTLFGDTPGGSTTVFSWDIAAELEWRPVPNVGLQAGYRNTSLNFRHGKDAERFEWEGGFAGLFFGLELRF